jgi:cytoskeletal protein RodZ
MFGMGYGWGNGFISVIGMFVCGVLAILAFAIAVGLIFLLVRFLLVATRAAQLYVAEHEPPRPMTPTAPATPAAPAAPAAKTAPAAAASTTPAAATTTSAATTKATTTRAAETAPTKPLAKPATAKPASAEPADAAAPEARPATKPRTPRTPPKD